VKESRKPPQILEVKYRYVKLLSHRHIKKGSIDQRAEPSFKRLEPIATESYPETSTTNGV
jgi:hypothetical protein